jgi:NAD(P)-dependent dehydrogenase (short-subunit alcohol dehydrogenase family)
MSPGRLAGLTALVTGSTRGLGRVIAEGYAEAGARLVAVGRRTEAWSRLRPRSPRPPAQL